MRMPANAPTPAGENPADQVETQVGLCWIESLSLAFDPAV